jgi:predicted regulator of Ras-like GTPase activity (Roadblock/LC7/MglB family)
LIHPCKQALIDRMLLLQQSSPDIEAAAVVSLDGLIIASALTTEMSEDRVSAMSAAMLSLGEQIGKEMRRGSLEQVHIKGANGCVDSHRRKSGSNVPGAAGGKTGDTIP